MMATQSSANINALHRQIFKGRKIVVTEDPQLHLIWLQDRIHIKPLPKCLLSHAFWNDVLLNPSPKGRPRQSLVEARTGLPALVPLPDPARVRPAYRAAGGPSTCTQGGYLGADQPIPRRLGVDP